MIRKLLKAFSRRPPEGRSVTFSRPLVLLHSDDWGRVGVRDKEGFNELRAAGIRLGEHPYDLYTLETADDVSALRTTLAKHHDSRGNPPCLLMNFCTANLDFEKMKSDAFERVTLLSLAHGLPGRWRRPGLLETYKKGIREGVFYPALHGRTHFCLDAVEHTLAHRGERERLLRALWQADTPYIHWRMPWVGYEFWDPRTGFISAEKQKALIDEACREFLLLFRRQPFSACAPGYRADVDTHRIWAGNGIRVAQNGSGSGLKAAHFDSFGILHLYRNLDFEPSQREVDVQKYLEIAAACFARGLPLVLSVHAINFHSTLKDFRTPTLDALDALLTKLEHKYSGLAYVNDEEIYGLATTGELKTCRGYREFTSAADAAVFEEVM